MTRSAAIRMMGPALLALVLWTVPANADEKGFVFKIATLAPEGSSWIKTFQALNAEIMKKTGNRVQFKVYPGGVLGDETDMLRKMQIGQIHGAALTSGSL